MILLDDVTACVLVCICNACLCMYEHVRIYIDMYVSAYVCMYDSDFWKRDDNIYIYIYIHIF